MMQFDEWRQSLLYILVQIYSLVESKTTWDEIRLGDSFLGKTDPEKKFGSNLAVFRYLTVALVRETSLEYKLSFLLIEL